MNAVTGTVAGEVRNLEAARAVIAARCDRLVARQRGRYCAERARVIGELRLAHDALSRALYPRAEALMSAAYDETAEGEGCALILDLVDARASMNRHLYSEASREAWSAAYRTNDAEVIAAYRAAFAKTESALEAASASAFEAVEAWVERHGESYAPDFGPGESWQEYRQVWGLPLAGWAMWREAEVSGPALRIGIRSGLIEACRAREVAS